MKIRQRDAHGSGVYRASRGNKLHNGIDVVCNVGDPVGTVASGTVTKIGYPYSQGPDADANKAGLRYVQITDKHGLDARYFYVTPLVEVGEFVEADTIIGTVRGVGHIYPGITEHFHFEVLKMVNGKKVFSDPEQYLAAN